MAQTAEIKTVGRKTGTVPAENVNGSVNKSAEGGYLGRKKERKTGIKYVSKIIENSKRDDFDLDWAEECIRAFGSAAEPGTDIRCRGRLREININFMYKAFEKDFPEDAFAFISRIDGGSVIFSVFGSERPAIWEWKSAGSFTLCDTDFLKIFRPHAYVRFSTDEYAI